MTEVPMRSCRREPWFNLPRRIGFVDITAEIEACLADSGVCEGLCLVKAWDSVFLLASSPSNWPVTFARVQLPEHL